MGAVSSTDRCPSIRSRFASTDSGPVAGAGRSIFAAFLEDPADGLIVAILRTCPPARKSVLSREFSHRARFPNLQPIWQDPRSHRYSPICNTILPRVSRPATRAGASRAQKGSRAGAGQ